MLMTRYRASRRRVISQLKHGLPTDPNEFAARLEEGLADVTPPPPTTEAGRRQDDLREETKAYQELLDLGGRPTHPIDAMQTFAAEPPPEYSDILSYWRIPNRAEPWFATFQKQLNRWESFRKIQKLGREGTRHPAVYLEAGPGVRWVDIVPGCPEIPAGSASFPFYMLQVKKRLEDNNFLGDFHLKEDVEHQGARTTWIEYLAFEYWLSTRKGYDKRVEVTSKCRPQLLKWIRQQIEQLEDEDTPSASAKRKPPLIENSLNDEDTPSRPAKRKSPSPERSHNDENTPSVSAKRRSLSPNMSPNKERTQEKQPKRATQSRKKGLRKASEELRARQGTKPIVAETAISSFPTEVQVTKAERAAKNRKSDKPANSGAATPLRRSARIANKPQSTPEPPGRRPLASEPSGGTKNKPKNTKAHTAQRKGVDLPSTSRAPAKDTAKSKGKGKAAT